MAKVMVAVELPEGYELACKEIRTPKKGEQYLYNSMRDSPGAVLARAEVNFVVSQYVIVRPIWQWPEWLMVPWVVKMSQDDDWWGHMREPHLRFNAQMWVATGATGHCFNLSRGFVDWTPPPCDDWTQSLRENPNRIKESE